MSTNEYCFTSGGGDAYNLNWPVGQATVRGTEVSFLNGCS